MELFGAIGLLATLCRDFDLVSCRRRYGNTLVSALDARPGMSAFRVGRPGIPPVTTRRKESLPCRLLQGFVFKHYSRYAESHFGSIQLLREMWDGCRNFHRAFSLHGSLVAVVGGIHDANHDGY